LKELLAYDLETGEWVWLVSNSNRVKVGSRAGSLNKTLNRCQIRIDGTLYYSSILAWFYMTKEWPKCEIDHEDLNPSNDKWTNLREASSQQQKWNQGKRKKNTSGITGVYWHKINKKWIAQARLNEKITYLGSFDKKEEARRIHDETILKYRDKEFVRLN